MVDVVVAFFVALECAGILIMREQGVQPGGEARDCGDSDARVDAVQSTPDKVKRNVYSRFV